jgi:hypothetical protein
MDRSVNVMRCRKSGAFLLNPTGTFVGHGGVIGITPRREIPDGVQELELGQRVIELLESSGPTGVHISEAKQFRERSRDAETKRVEAAYRLDRPGLSTSRLARRFLHATVEHRHRQKSWVITVFQYDSRLRAMSAADDVPVRVPISSGAAALGAALHRRLPLE